MERLEVLLERQVAQAAAAVLLLGQQEAERQDKEMLDLLAQAALAALVVVRLRLAEQHLQMLVEMVALVAALTLLGLVQLRLVLAVLTLAAAVAMERQLAAMAELAAAVQVAHLTRLLTVQLLQAVAVAVVTTHPHLAALVALE